MFFMEITKTQLWFTWKKVSREWFCDEYASRRERRDADKGQKYERRKKYGTK